MDKKENIILSLGGSLIAPSEIDIGFLNKFKSVVLSHIKDKRFIIFTGGGKIARLYQHALVAQGANSQERDWAGINVSRLNAEVVRSLFGKNAYPRIITDPTENINMKKDIVVGAGWKPGWSTDYVATMAAGKVKAGTIINLTNIDYVCDKDPRKFKDAKPLKEISWTDFRKLVGDKWSPGYSSPFDPIASKVAQKAKIKVIIINGRYLERLEDFLNNKEFVGTKIQ